MKQFSDRKTMDEIIHDAEKGGWEVDTDAFHQKGSDFIYIRDMTKRLKQIAINVTNGHFFVYEPSSEEATATHLSSELDDVPWYKEILTIVYETSKDVSVTTE